MVLFLGWVVINTMPSPLFIGSTSFRQIDSEETANRRGPDLLAVTLRGKYSELDAELAKWPKGKVGTSLGYSNMYLQSSRKRQSSGSWGDLILNFEGFIENTAANPISVEDSISLQSTTLTSDESDDDGDAVSVQVSFYGQVTTTRWMHYAALAPKSPRYKIVVASNIDAGSIFDPSPPSYNGTLQAKVSGRLIQFARTRITEGVWLVVESWQNRVEPAESTLISFAE